MFYKQQSTLASLFKDEQAALFMGIQSYRRINVEHLVLYKDINNKLLHANIYEALRKQMSGSPLDQQHATHWGDLYNDRLNRLALQLTKDVLSSHSALPSIGLKGLPNSAEALLKTLSKAPNDYLCHFQLAWIYSAQQQHTLAERHFNVAALQSQSLNALFSCYAYRHLANTRYRMGKYTHALLAIESAREQHRAFNPELQLEYIRLLSQAQRTSQALKQLSQLIIKAPHYEVLASIEPDIQSNPSLQRYLNQRRQQHQLNIAHLIETEWDNDPLQLLNLDRELGQAQSLARLRDKQQQSLTHMPLLLLHDESSAARWLHTQSRHLVMRGLDAKKQGYIEQIETHQDRANRLHALGQWLVYGATIALISLSLSHGISIMASHISLDWPINPTIQSFVLTVAIMLSLVGATLLHFSPKKLSRLIKQKQHLEQLSSRLI